MKLRGIKDVTIAREKYKWSKQISKKLSYDKWIKYIDANQDYFVWLENTEKGRERLRNINKIPESFKIGILEQLNKTQALAEYNNLKGWHEIIIDFHKDLGILKTTIMKNITKDHLKRLLNMANYLDAYLLNNGMRLLTKRL